MTDQNLRKIRRKMISETERFLIRYIPIPKRNFISADCTGFKVYIVGPVVRHIEAGVSNYHREEKYLVRIATGVGTLF